MLLVDPMNRVTIPEIRQHPWFLNHLPRYLAVPPPDTTQQAKRVRVLQKPIAKQSCKLWIVLRNDFLYLLFICVFLLNLRCLEKLPNQNKGLNNVSLD